MVLHKPATPPMGWNSWDCYGTTVTEAEVLANAEFMAEHLLPYGWDTIVVDIDWSDPDARSHGYTDAAALTLDKFGRPQPAVHRFPSAAGGEGFAPLAARLHELGLKFGIHVMRGIPRTAVAANLPVAGTDATGADIADPTNSCEWNPHYVGLDHRRPAAQAYYDSCVAQFAEWGVDFLKADDMLWPYQAREIEAYAAAIEKVSREIGLSLSPGRDLSAAHLEHLRAHSTMWRVCDDVWDRWEDIEPNFERLARWAPFASAAGWPDADMLPLGRIGIRAERGEPREGALTLAERRSLMTLWIMARSPLMIGGDLPTSAAETIELFRNEEVLRILRDSHGNRELLRENGLVAWGADGVDGEHWAAVFNLNGEPLELTIDTGSLGLTGADVTDVWAAASVPLETVNVQSDAARGVAPGSRALRVRLDAHGCVLLRG